ncbi:MAG: hypothetical protein HYS24_03630 [Ignavibacteriales bacterium]|nr:hypothetical protein [Ignavibacteriales bacterium]
MSLKTRVNLIILIVLFGINICHGQNFVKVQNLKSEFILKENKDQYYKTIIDEINRTLSENEIKSSKWIFALDNAQSIFYDSSIVKNAVDRILKLPVDKNVKLQISALETAYTLYKNDFNNYISEIAKKTNDQTSLAIAVNYLLNNSANKIIASIEFLDTIERKFDNAETNSILRNVKYHLENIIDPNQEQIPSLTELFNHKYQNGKTIIFSVHRKNRHFPGITIIKRPDGEFVKNKDGSVFNIPQLAISFSNLPAYIPNGNTPQGVYSIIGTYVSSTQTIGPTPNILLRSPFEVSPNIFYHNENKIQSWQIEDYRNLLPQSWKNYFPIYQSFYAGEIGRKLIIMHGSTDDLSLYKDLPYFPYTPTKGCLSSKEIWDDQNGKCIESDQVKLLNAFYSTYKKKGFLVVVEIDDKEMPVTIDEIEQYINKGPQR